MKPGIKVDAPPRFVLPLPWLTPPLSQNSRYPHWTKQREAEAAVRDAVTYLARQAMEPAGRAGKRAPFDGPYRIVLLWTVTDRHKRDTDNVTPTLKYAIDGLRHAKFLADDHWAIVPVSYVRIRLGSAKSTQLIVTQFVEDGEFDA